MLNLNAIFTKRNFDNWCVWEYVIDDYQLYIWAGISVLDHTYHYSVPSDIDLSLNEYNTITFRIINKKLEPPCGDLTSKQMHELFGFDLRRFGSGANNSRNVPIDVVRDIIKRISPLLIMPADAGDGE